MRMHQRDKIRRIFALEIRHNHPQRRKQEVFFLGIKSFGVTKMY